MPCPFLLRIYVGTGGNHTHRDYAFLPLAMFHHEAMGAAHVPNEAAPRVPDPSGLIGVLQRTRPGSVQSPFSSVVRSAALAEPLIAHREDRAGSRAREGGVQGGG